MGGWRLQGENVCRSNTLEKEGWVEEGGEKENYVGEWEEEHELQDPGRGSWSSQGAVDEGCRGRRGIVDDDVSGDLSGTKVFVQWS